MGAGFFLDGTRVAFGLAGRSPVSVVPSAAQQASSNDVNTRVSF